MAAYRNQAGAGPLTLEARSLAFLSVLLIAACTPSDGDPQLESVSETPRSAAQAPSASERDAILAPLQGLFDALEAGDAELLRSVVAPGTLMSFTETRDGTTTLGTATLDQLAERITSSPVPLIERMWDPVVRVDGPLATIWTPYDFYAGSELSHCGIDAATLLLSEDGWRIVGLSWTRDQPPACELHPDGPPAR
ncbi:MAG: hypothetical protein WEA34_14515 [Gemmatimonadota bacterium]